jgi:bacterioferritin
LRSALQAPSLYGKTHPLEEFLEHAVEEQGHADQIEERITQLDGEPNFNPNGLLTHSHSEYVEGESLAK